MVSFCLCQGSFAEVKVYSVGLFAVVSCLKQENYTIPRKGLSLKLPMDPRICLNYLPGSFTAPVIAQTTVWQYPGHYPFFSYFTFSRSKEKSCRSEVWLALRDRKSFLGRSLWNDSKTQMKIERRNDEVTKSLLLICRRKVSQMFAVRHKQLWPISQLTPETKHWCTSFTTAVCCLILRQIHHLPLCTALFW